MNMSYVEFMPGCGNLTDPLEPSSQYDPADWIKGCEAWNKGKTITFTVEHRANLAKAAKRNKVHLQTQTPEAKAKRRASMKGRQFSHAHRANLSAVQIGKKHPRRSKLSFEQMAEIKLRLLNGEGPSALAREYRLARKTIYNLKSGVGCYAQPSEGGRHDKGTGA
jgi:hypothetical protein